MKRFVTVSVAVFCALMLVAPEASAATLTGSDLTEIIGGTNKSDKISGLGGNDAIFAMGNTRGATGNRRFDFVDGGEGTDIILLGSGVDRGSGGNEADDMFDSDGKPGDISAGGAGADRIAAADGARDTVDCGTEADVVVADPVDVLVNCGGDSITTADGAATISGTTFAVDFLTPNNDSVTGTVGPDYLLGLGGNDTLRGDEGGDRLDGGIGRDALGGGGGGDVLIDDDGAGSDGLSGGSGPDLILSADGASDVINCGQSDEEVDTVVVDPSDRLFVCGDDNVFRISNIVVPAE